jgi:hypothetical protein
MAAAVLAVALGGCSGIRDSLGIGKHPPDEFQVVSRAPLSMPPDFNLRPPQPGVPRPQEGTARDQAQSAIFNAGAQPATGEAGAPAVSAAPTVPVQQDTLDAGAPTLATVNGPAASSTAAPAISTFSGSMAATPAPTPATPSAAPAPGAAAPQLAATTGSVSSGEAALLQRSGAEKADPGIRQTVDLETKQIREADTSFIDRLIFWQKTPEPGVVVDPAKEQQRLQENAALGKPVTEGETPVIERKRRAWLEGIF